MAGTKISALTAGAALGGTEALPAVQTAATVKITATQIKTFVSASPTLVTPVLGVATGTSLALGGATIGSNALAVTGPSVFNYAVSGMGLYSVGNGQGFVSAVNNGEYQVSVNPYGLRMASGATLEWGSNAADGRVGNSVILTRAADATLRHGAADAASPVAQTIKFQDVVAGTSNTAGVNATIQAPAGTGTGAGGSLIFQVAPAGSSGTAKNAWATALTIDSDRNATFTGSIVAAALRLGGSNTLSWTSGSYYFGNATTGAATGTARIVGNTTTALNFGGDTSSFPTLKRSGAELHLRWADDSGWASMQAGQVSLWGGLYLSAGTTSRPTLNVPAGVAPTSPSNGDIWSDGSDLKVRLGGVTYTLTKV